jgi:DNA invertase Pin-like site-specific DNA recombinase
MTVAVYVRVSTQRQAQAQTIEQQLERLREHLRSQGMALTSERIFRDDGYSGATLNRPGLDRLRDAVRAGEIEQVLVTDPDRLARNYVKLMVLLEELERAGCEVTFLDRPMGRDPQDQLMLQIRGAVAEYERTLIAERMRRGRQAKLRAGCLLPWSRAPYGYRLDPDRPRDPAGVTVEPTEAAMVQELFALESAALERSGAHQLAQPGQASARLGHRLADRPAALADELVARHPDQPDLHRPGLCRPLAQPSRAHPALGDPPDRQVLGNRGAGAGGAPVAGGEHPGPDQRGAVRAGPGQAGAEPCLRPAPQHGACLSAARLGQLWCVPLELPVPHGPPPLRLSRLLRQRRPAAQPTREAVPGAFCPGAPAR